MEIKSVLDRQQIVKECKQVHQDYFNSNLGKGTSLTTFCMIQGHFIHCNTIIKRKMDEKIQNVLQEIKLKERQLKNLPENSNTLNKLKLLNNKLVDCFSY